MRTGPIVEPFAPVVWNRPALLPAKPIRNGSRSSAGGFGVGQGNRAGAAGPGRARADQAAFRTKNCLGHGQPPLDGKEALHASLAHAFGPLGAVRCGRLLPRYLRHLPAHQLPQLLAGGSGGPHRPNACWRSGDRARPDAGPGELSLFNFPRSSPAAANTRGGFSLPQPALRAVSPARGSAD